MDECTVVKAYKCYICENIYENEDDLKKHIKDVHAEKPCKHTFINIKTIAIAEISVMVSYSTEFGIHRTYSESPEYGPEITVPENFVHKCKFTCKQCGKNLPIEKYKPLLENLD